MDPDAPHTTSGYRWYILALATLTNTLVAAVPSMAMPVLFKEISVDLRLDLVQVGLAWGITALPGIVTVLLGGVIGDRIGPKRVLVASCLLVGLAGGLRGLVFNFASLAASMFLMGLVAGLITLNTLKICGMWFSRRQLGLASGVLSMGMALGFLVGSMFSASLLSPWLGGWRRVLFLYGAIDVALALPWLLSRLPRAAGGVQAIQPSLRQNLVKVARIRNIWLFGLTLLGISGCLQGALGYLPLYLRGQGWPELRADSALATFHTVSMICVVPIALLSDRLRSRKKVLVAAGLMTTAGVGLLGVAQGGLVWIAVLLAGMVRDGFMAVFMTAILETEGVGAEYAGSAIGLVMVFSGIGNLLSPPLGNSLASFSPGLPFLFWSALTLLALGGLLGTRESAIHPGLVAEEA